MNKVYWQMVALLFAITLGVFVFLPVFKMQAVLWAFAAVIFVIGDSATTSLFQRYDELEEAGPFTRVVCGPNPSVKCAFGTRIGIFVAMFLPYVAIIEIGSSTNLTYLMILGGLIPLVLTIAGLLAVVHNGVGIAMAELNRRKARGSR